MRKFMIDAVFLLFLLCSTKGFAVLPVSADITYTYFTGESLTFSLNKMLYHDGHVIGKLQDCTSKLFPKCVQFDHTIIGVPNKDILPTGDFGDIKEGIIPGSQLSYSIEKARFHTFGNKREGYVIKLGDISNYKYSSKSERNDYYGLYFYSPGLGVLNYLHFKEKFDINLNQFYLDSEYLLSREKHGLFK